MKKLKQFFNWLFEAKPDETEMSSWIRYAKTRELEEMLLIIKLAKNEKQTKRN